MRFNHSKTFFFFFSNLKPQFNFHCSMLRIIIVLKNSTGWSMFFCNISQYIALVNVSSVICNVIVQLEEKQPKIIILPLCLTVFWGSDKISSLQFFHQRVWFQFCQSIIFCSRMKLTSQDNNGLCVDEPLFAWASTQGSFYECLTNCVLVHRVPD